MFASVTLQINIFLLPVAFLIRSSAIKIEHYHLSHFGKQKAGKQVVADYDYVPL